jgi:hypothetical protein
LSIPTLAERQEAAEATKKAMLEKFKTKAQAPVDPKVAQERAAAAVAREEKRLEAEKRRRERVELEKLERKLAAEAKAKADEEDDDAVDDDPPADALVGAGTKRSLSGPKKPSGAVPSVPRRRKDD